MRAKHVPRLLLVCAALSGTVHAADPAFQSSIVTDSRVYQRQASSFRIVGVPAAVGKTVDVSRVTDVLAAIERNRLLLKSAGGDVVTAKIVSREKQKPESSRGNKRD
jgi:hypothetical protein